MVRITMMLARTPVIKFRKGKSMAPASGGSKTSAPGVGTCGLRSRAAPTASSTQPVAAMSTSAIPDIDLPLRYKRAPLSQEEIDHINGGGIV